MLVFMSQIIVLAIGATVIVLAGWGIFAPGKLMAFVASVMNKHWGIYIAVFVRLALGAALIILAPASHFPLVFQAVGGMTIFAAIALALMGRERIRRFIVWWSERLSTRTIRLWLLLGTVFGGFLIYGVL